MHFQGYTNSFLGDITGLLSQTGWTHEQIEGQLTSISRLSSSESGQVLIAVEDQKLVGFASVEVHRWNNLAQIQGLIVDKNCRRRGIALALIERIEQFARMKKVRGIYVDTPETNVAARKVYEKKGFNQAYIMPEYYGEGEDGVTFQKMYK